ncbi:MAG: hypothetical protein CSA22_06945 [Deltaproteobacteria bacterium]|nr:MAG: hypothetical protein CSA22_06945 [Deltaproteobacteria bacterium]
MSRYINGEGETSRDFCYIDNCVQANVRAGGVDQSKSVKQIMGRLAGDLFKRAVLPAVPAGNVRPFAC